MCLVVGQMVVINLYAASGRQGSRERQVFFGETVERLVRSYSRNLPVILGDFNCILENEDAANNPQQKKCEALRQLINLYNYVDIYRKVYPNKILSKTSSGIFQLPGKKGSMSLGVRLQIVEKLN